MAAIAPAEVPAKTICLALYNPYFLFKYAKCYNVLFIPLINNLVPLY